MDCRFIADAERDRRFSFVQIPLSNTMGVYAISCPRLDAHSTYSFRMQVHVMNALKGAGPVHQSFDYDTPLYIPQRVSTYKARPKSQGCVLVSTDVRQTPKEDKTNLILRPKAFT